MPPPTKLFTVMVYHSNRTLRQTLYVTMEYNWAWCDGCSSFTATNRFQSHTWNLAFVIVTTILKCHYTFIICWDTKDVSLGLQSPHLWSCATILPVVIGLWLTFKLLLLTDWSTRRLGGCFLWIRFRKSTLTTCCEMVSWKRSNTWHRLLSVRFFWFS